MGLLVELREDLLANRGNTKGAFICVWFRLAHALVSGGVLPRILGLPVVAGYKLAINWLLGVDLDCHAKVGGGLAVYHGQGLVVNRRAVIGRGVVLRHTTTIGHRREGGGSPRIGNGVQIGAHVVILGDITIGDGAVIGAGAVVIRDVPPRAVVAGNPARLIGGADA